MPVGSAAAGDKNAAVTPGEQQPTFRAIFRVVTVVVVSALSLYLIYRLRQPIGWLLAAAFIAVAVTPPVNRLSKHMPRGAAIALIYVVVLIGVPVGMGALLVPPMVDQSTQLAQDLPRYAQEVTDFVERNDRLRELDAKYDITGSLEEQASQVPKHVGDAAKVLTNIGLGLVSSIFALVNILILSIFMLLGGRGWVNGFIGLRPVAEREHLRRTLEQTAKAISGYVQGALLIGVIAGVQTLIVLSILGVPFAGALAVVAGVASLIPLIGATIAAVLIGLIVLVTKSLTAVIIWAVWAIIYQQLENNIVQPQVQKRTVSVQPIVVLIAVLFGSTLLGIGGAIVAIPAAAAIQITIAEWRDWRRTQLLIHTGEIADHNDDALAGEDPEPEPAA